MKRRGIWLSLFMAGCLTVGAQGSGPGSMPVDPLNLLGTLLGPGVGFTATAEISGFSTNANNDFVVDVDYTFLAGQLRTIVDLTQLRGLKACDYLESRDPDFDSAITIKLPELKRAYVVYPRLRAYVETVLTWREHTKEVLEITKTKLRDTIVGDQPCTEYRVHVINKLGDEYDVRVWEATELDNFPVQLQFETEATVFTIRFRNLQRTPPDIELFQPPAGFDRYTSLPELTRALKGR
ncbi:MAG: hypothetical protein PCFJNLEI_03968 [Verrucomicrobiae bacterium]|nr:hypothetical protein [Verrucomicrobiae bacterium]